MFTVQERNSIRDRLLDIARNDHRIASAAFVGSTSEGGDRWSDLDLTFGVAEEASLSEVLNEWTDKCEKEFQALKLFDLVSGPSIYRVFLFPRNLQVDLSFTPSKEFGSAGPKFHLLWGNNIERKRALPPAPDYLFGLAVHHLVRARICIERGKLWQAEYWINEARNHALTLACLRFGLETSNGRGFDSLPKEILGSFAETLQREISREQLLMALGKTLDGLLQNSNDLVHASRLAQELQELKSSNLDYHQSPLRDEKF